MYGGPQENIYHLYGMVHICMNLYGMVLRLYGMNI